MSKDLRVCEGAALVFEKHGSLRCGFDLVCRAFKAILIVITAVSSRGSPFGWAKSQFRLELMPPQTRVMCESSPFFRPSDIGIDDDALNRHFSIVVHTQHRGHHEPSERHSVKYGFAKPMSPLYRSYY